MAIDYEGSGLFQIFCTMALDTGHSLPEHQRFRERFDSTGPFASYAQHHGPQSYWPGMLKVYTGNQECKDYPTLIPTSKISKILSSQYYSEFPSHERNANSGNDSD